MKMNWDLKKNKQMKIRDKGEPYLVYRKGVMKYYVILCHLVQSNQFILFCHKFIVFHDYLITSLFTTKQICVEWECIGYEVCFRNN